MEEITILGTVDTVAVGGSSKSAHEALAIRTPSDQYIFRVIGENPFEMSALHADLRGKLVRASGYLTGQVLMVRSFKIE